ncbi:MAG: methyltransferase domain-containing protein, partial [Actinomycetota bacterium]|nr:methyltransferase domain-containing protein [Actinomycetota bacterium]
MNERLDAALRRFARLATRAVVAFPRLWRLFRGPVRAQFDRLAASWESRRGPEDVASLAAALETLGSTPARILDLGTGTGRAARLLARRFPSAEVVGVDLSPLMIDEARLNLAQAAIYLACAPKSNASYRALAEATQDVREHGLLRPPKMLQS